ncbi:hypothetical protein J2X04_001823 [Lysobacter niabensis]|uniref:Uncharacterized protein n=1 Tax=Agrilutibacter niabensis TaxID=380628 RepID=A0ABU1VPR6_9GAMM|nr:hypothetical protein [Lysobacter niabensis]MDR7099476.1 hypothetical protein [Lysobacter niabensis]
MLPPPLGRKQAWGVRSSAFWRLVVAWLTITLCEFASMFLHHPPPSIDLRDPQALAAHVAAAPTPVMLIVLAGWSLAAFLGGWIAARIARHHRAAALVIGTLVVVIVLAKRMLIAYPLWMTVAGVLLPLSLAWLAARLATPRTSP